MTNPLDTSTVDDTGLQVVSVAAPVRAEVVRKLRQAIVNRTFTPGQRLVERELCELTGVSRTSVREALRQLESEGLVQLVPNRGPIVAKVTRKEAADLYQVRAVLEALAAQQFAKSASDAHIAALQASLATIEEAAEAGDVERFVNLKDDFYDVFLGGADNEILKTMLDSVHSRVHYLRLTSLRQEQRLQVSVGEVREVVDAIARRDEQAAWRLARAHILSAAAIALEHLQD
jgi:GntR family transcriptional regulator, trigonelline degradation regulator